MQMPRPLPLRPRPPRRGAVSALRVLLAHEAAGGIVLIAAAAMAMVIANGPLGPAYRAALHAKLGPLSLLHWINDGLMAMFFLLVGLEIKREFLDGQLARWSDRALPGIAALAGMAGPAALYLAIAGDQPGLARGWAIPAATDIAFALGVLALLGRRVPPSLKLLLLGIAIADDLGAVVVIAVFYTGALQAAPLLAAASILAAMAGLRCRRMERLWPYLLLAAALWLAVFLSGVHATVAGVAAALAIPLRGSPGRPDEPASPLHRLEHALQPVVAFGIVPVFGFANAGVDLGAVGRADLLAPLTLGVAAGLFLGKQLGVVAGVGLAAALRLARRPQGARWAQVYGVALLCGVGFTMSLFVGELAFADPVDLTRVKLGVLGGSLASALAGFVVLRVVSRVPDQS